MYAYFQQGFGMRWASIPIASSDVISCWCVTLID